MRTFASRLPPAIFTIAIASLAAPAYATHIAGERFFPVPLVIEDVGVEDELSLHPSTVYHRSTDGMPGNHQTDLNFEFQKTITDELGIGISDAYTFLSLFENKRHVGWQNVATTLKYQFIEDDERELISSVGVIREWGGTGRGSVGADAHGSTTPTLYFGKGLGDLPVDVFRPLAITGTFGLQVPDVPKDDPHQAVVGLSLQYSIPYLQKHTEHLELPDFVSRLTPIVEFTYTRPTGDSHGVRAEGTVAPGFTYTGDTYQLGLEALIPTTRASGTGVIAQFHVFFSDIFPETLGKPIF